MNNMLAVEINWTTVGIIIAICSLLAIIFATLIVIVSKLCQVKEDTKTTQITEHLAGANCGACGYNGCADFAKALAEGKADIKLCNATSNEDRKVIAEILGLPFVAVNPCYAIVKCSGGNNAKDKYSYVGNGSCISQVTFMGGRKSCSNGCLGGGSCVEVCPHNAIKIKNDVAVIDKALCEGCGICVNTCPKKLIELIPRKSKVQVICSSICKGKEVVENCSSGCIACNLCVKNCPENAISMVNNLPKIDYDKCSGCRLCATKCPRKIIKPL